MASAGLPETPLAPAGAASVVLTPEELRICAWVGKMRQENAEKLHRAPGLGPSHASGGLLHIRGAECEFACSLMLNLSWRPAIGQIDQRDVGGLIEVRSTVLQNGKLIIKPTDDDAIFALIVKEGVTRFRFGGWIFSSEAKLYPLVTGKGDPAHFIKQRDLWSLNDLKRVIRSKG